MLKRVLIPRALVITPNLPEAAALLDAPLRRRGADARAGRALLALGARAVLIKGGHGEGAESVDLLIEPTAVTRLAAERVATENTHGTGCTLSSAIAAGLAKGLDLARGVARGKNLRQRGNRCLASGLLSAPATGPCTISTPGGSAEPPVSYSLWLCGIVSQFEI